MKTIVFLCLALIAFAQAQTLQVRVTAYFSNTVCSNGGNNCKRIECGGTSQSSCADSGYGSSSLPPYQVRWGEASSGSSKSGLGFNGTVSTTGVNTDFYIGSLNHFNFPISSGSAADSTNLNLVVVFSTTAGVTVATQTFTFKMTIDETPNSGSASNCPYPSTVACSDRITYPAGGFDTTKSFTYNDVSYTLQLKGFKESRSSTSLAVTDFISNEGGSRIAYLFARITAACPSTCIGGGSVIITPDSRCVCDCSTASTCAYPKSFSSDCSCVCPSGLCLNGGTTRPTDCSCDCSTASACAAPKALGSDCTCACPSNYCNGYPISNVNTCACSCPDAATLNCGPNFEVSPTCECACNRVCPAPFIRDPNPAICNCICPNTCAENFRQNSTCGCECNKRCPNGQILDRDTCTCGDCVGDWVKNTTDGLCTICGLTNCTNPAETVDATACACVCTSLNCNLFNNSEVVDTTQSCACRPCVAGECICGNGKLEVGEQCDTGNLNDPCCKDCQYTVDPCDDGKACTSGDRCDGSGSCNGRYKCSPDSDCTQWTCDEVLTSGDCLATFAPNDTMCESFKGAGDADLCVRGCYNGACALYPTEGDRAKLCFDNDTTDCLAPRCVSSTGLCEYFVVADGSQCSDGLACTERDQCISGVCRGTEIDCYADPYNLVETQCTVPKCDEQFTSFQCINASKENSTPCEDGNLCTLNDICFKGSCIPSRKTVRCPRATTCMTYYCDRNTGDCAVTLSSNDTLCDDQNVCTENDRCNNGTCSGEATDNTKLLAACGYVPPPTEQEAGTNSIIVLASVLGAALAGAVVAAALIIKKIQKSRLLDPETWNPDMFSSVGANPFYQASQKMVDSPMYEGNGSVN